MGQKPFHVSALTMTLFGLSDMLDRGRCDDITLDDVKRHAKVGDLVAWLTEKANGDFASGYFRGNPEFAEWYAEKIADLCLAMDGRERRKYGIENRGICLLISYTAELIQQGEDIVLNDR